MNNVIASKIYRVPVDAGNAGTPVETALDQPIDKPDGMRVAKGKLLVAENRAGKISGAVTVIQDGLMTPAAVEPGSDTIWIAERGTGKAASIPTPK